MKDNSAIDIAQAKTIASSRTLVRSIAAVLYIVLVCCMATSSTVTAGTIQMNTAEMKLFKLVSRDADQQRTTLKLDPILCKVARVRAADMIRRNYFAHVDPDGKSANYYVRLRGYVLPSSYSPSDSVNNIESIGMSATTPASVLAAWKGEEGHRVHLMGVDPFYRAQTSIGVGMVRSPKEPHYKYFVFISAPPNLSANPPLWILKNPDGKVIATTGTATK